jgi:hypothetical protein
MIALNPYDVLGPIYEAYDGPLPIPMDENIARVKENDRRTRWPQRWRLQLKIAGAVATYAAVVGLTSGLSFTEFFGAWVAVEAVALSLHGANRFWGGSPSH